MRATTWVLISAPLFLASVGYVVTKGCAATTVPTVALSNTDPSTTDVATSETRTTSGAVATDETSATDMAAGAPAPPAEATAAPPVATAPASAPATTTTTVEAERAPVTPREPVGTTTTTTVTTTTTTPADASATPTSVVVPAVVAQLDGSSPSDAAPVQDSGVVPLEGGPNSAVNIDPTNPPPADWPRVITSGAYEFGDGG